MEIAREGGNLNGIKSVKCGSTYVTGIRVSNRIYLLCDPVTRARRVSRFQYRWKKQEIYYLLFQLVKSKIVRDKRNLDRSTFFCVLLITSRISEERENWIRWIERRKIRRILIKKKKTETIDLIIIKETRREN